MTLNRPSSEDHRERTGNFERDSFRLSPIDFLENVFDHRYVFLAIFLTFLLLSIAFTIVATPVYSVDALIQVEENKPSALGSLSEISKALDIQNSAVLGEIDIARSRTVVTEAINATVAQARVSVKNRIPLVGRPLGSLLPKEANGLVVPFFDTPFVAWGGEKLEFKAFDVPGSQIGKTFEFDYLEGNVFLLKDSSGKEVLRGVVGKPGVGNGYHVEVSQIVARFGTEFGVKRVPTNVQLEAVLQKLSAVETKRQSGIMQLSFEDADPVYAARLLNAITAAYLDFNSRRRAEDAERSVAFLNTQLPLVKARLQHAEQALNTFRNTQGSIDAQGDVKLLIDQLALVEKSRLEAKLEYQDLLSKYVPGQPQLVAAANKFKELDQQSAELRNKAAHLPSQQQTYLRLARDVEVNNQLYVGLLNNTQQLQIAEAGTVGNASVIDNAEISDRPIRPKRVLVILMGTVVGLLLGFAAAQGLELFFGRIRDPKRLEAMTGIPMLGVLPASLHQNEADMNNVRAFLLAKEQPDTPLVEAMENLTLSLQYKLAADRGKSKVILITSPASGQGRSIISANLAYLLSEKGLKTLLVEADVRNASIHRYLPVKAEKGLSDVLRASIHPMKAISYALKNLDVLPAGKYATPVRSLFGTANLQSLIASLRREYDMIVIDSPSALLLSDVTALSSFADIALLVARQGSVSYTGVMGAIESLSKVGARVDGLVFNGFAPSPLRYGYYTGTYRHTSKTRHHASARDIVSGTNRDEALRRSTT